MKKFFGIIAIAVLFAIPAMAQVPTYAVQNLWTGTNYANTGTNFAYTGLTAPVIDCRRQANVVIEWDVAAVAATGTNAIAVQQGIIGTSSGLEWQPIQLYVLNNLAAGTNVAHTNITVNGYGYLRVPFMTNWFSAGDLTNCHIRYAIKTGAP